MKKKIYGLIILIISMSLVITFWKHKSFNAMTFWDTMFILSLILTLLGASMSLLNSGFFESYTKQFKNFFKQMSRTEHLISEIENKQTHAGSVFFEFTLAKLFILTGISLTLISGIISIIIF